MSVLNVTILPLWSGRFLLLTVLVFLTYGWSLLLIGNWLGLFLTVEIRFEFLRAVEKV